MTGLLHEPWPSLVRQREAAQFGMWLFLATEVLFFGGLFGGYAVYRHLHPEGFLAGARATEIVYGGINTAVLLASSFTMAVGARAARAGIPVLARSCFVLTAVLGAAFLVLKGFEYAGDISRHLIPGRGFALAAPGADIFWTFYWLMTGVHAFHLVIGIGAVLWLLTQSRDPAWLHESAASELTALYWHFVDAVWVFLFPLLYLGGRA
jgi:cytochrome c oxidase subunit III